MTPQIPTRMEGGTVGREDAPGFNLAQPDPPLFSPAAPISPCFLLYLELTSA